MEWLLGSVVLVIALVTAFVLAHMNERHEREAAVQQAEWDAQDREWAGLDEEEDDDQYWHPDRDAAYPIEQWHEHTECPHGIPYRYLCRDCTREMEDHQ